MTPSKTLTFVADTAPASVSSRPTASSQWGNRNPGRVSGA